MRMLFPWNKKKIEKVLLKEVRRKYGKKVIKFNIVNKQQHIATYYITFEDGSVIHATVDCKNLLITC